jgi:hypothetical protein
MVFMEMPAGMVPAKFRAFKYNVLYTGEATADNKNTRHHQNHTEHDNL